MSAGRDVCCCFDRAVRPQQQDKLKLKLKPQVAILLFNLAVLGSWPEVRRRERLGYAQAFLRITAAIRSKRRV